MAEFLLSGICCISFVVKVIPYVQHLNCRCLTMWSRTQDENGERYFQSSFIRMPTNAWVNSEHWMCHSW